MFDLTSSKLLILAVVALIVVGPKDLPALLRTLGRYMGMIRRQANEFRTQFEDAMRDTELADLKKEVETLGRDTQDTLRDATQSVETQLGDVTRDVNNSLSQTDKPRDALGDATGSDTPPAALDASPESPALPASEPAPEAPSAPPAAEPKPVAEADTARSGA